MAAVDLQQQQECIRLIHYVGTLPGHVCAKFDRRETQGKFAGGQSSKGGSVKKSINSNFLISGVETISRTEMVQSAKLCANVPRMLR